jgi:hypothetical protein
MESHLGEEENEIVFFDDSAGHEDQGEERSQQSWNIIFQVKLTILFLVNFTYDSKSRGFFLMNDEIVIWNQFTQQSLLAAHKKEEEKKIFFYLSDVNYLTFCGVFLVRPPEMLMISTVRNLLIDVVHQHEARLSLLVAGKELNANAECFVQLLNGLAENWEQNSVHLKA